MQVVPAVALIGVLPLPALGCVALVDAGIWNEKPPERVGSDHLLHGRGLALGGWEGGNGPASVSALLDADGCYRFILAQVDLTGSFTSLVQIAAYELEAQIERSGAV